MTEHPLTDELLKQIGCSNPRARVFDTQAMRSAADWQLEQVMKWLDENLSNYTDDDYNDDCDSIHLWMRDDLKKAMRPQENN